MRVLEYADEEARRLQCRSLSTEHLLLDLIRESEGMAGRVLAALDLELDHLRTLMLDLYRSTGHLDNPEADRDR